MRTLFCFAIAMLAACNGKNTNNTEPVINSQSAGAKDSAVRSSIPVTNRDSMMIAYWEYGYKNASYDKYKEDAVQSLEQFLLLAKADTVHVYVPYAWQLLGIQYNILGDLRKSAIYSTLFNNYFSGLPDQYASGVINTSILLNELELYDSVANLTAGTLRMKGIVPKRKAALYANLAAAQSKMHRYEEALTNANTALKIIRQLPPQEIDKNIREKEYQLLWNLGEIQSSSGNDTAAAATLDRALNLAFHLYKNSFKNREAGKMFIARGKVAEKLGRPQESLLYYQKALGSVAPVDTGNIEQLPADTSIYTENTIMEALDAKANLLQKLYSAPTDTGKLGLAIRCYQLAFSTESKLMQGFSYDESLARQARESRARSEQAIAACYLLYKTTGNHRWAEMAFLFAEKSKSVVLLESIRKHIAAANISANDSLLQKVQLLQLKTAYYEKEISITSLNADSLRRKKQEAEKELLDAKTRLMLSNSGYREALLQPDTFSLTALRDKIPENTAIVEFFEGKEQVWSFIISAGSPVQLLQYDASLVNLTGTFLNYFTGASAISNDPSGYLHTANKLYNKLEWPRMDQQWKKLIIIPDGRFSFLPFDALITKLRATPDLQQANYLLRKYQPAYAYSAAILLKQLNRPATASEMVYAFAPVFAGKQYQQQPLPNTKHEVESIYRHAKGNMFLSSEATLANFRKQLGGQGILHIASHAYADTARAAVPRIEFIDSALLLNELYALQTNASLVVLSACETGIGNISRSEGPLSLARGFYYAGADNVITSLWNVDDKSTAQLFAEFYSNMGRLDYMQSLAAAKLDYLEQASAENASPYYWAAFVHIGYPAEKNAGSKWWLLLPVLVLVVACIVIFRKKSLRG